MGYKGAGPGVGRYTRFTFVLAAGVTSISGVDALGLTLAYRPNYMWVEYMGKTLPPQDITATDGSSVSWTTPSLLGDVVEVFSLNTYSPADALSLTQNGADISDKVAFRSYLPNPGAIFGLHLSTAGSSATMSIAAGFAADRTNTRLMRLASALAKTTSAWAPGNNQGGLDASTIANNTFYAFYEIMNPTSGAVDVIFSTNASAPTLPSGYTLYRRIGFGKTNGSAQWTSFVQSGDYFRWVTPSAISQTNNPGTSAVTQAIDTPLGVAVDADLTFIARNDDTSNITYCLVTALDETNSTPSPTLSDTAGTALYSGGSQISAANKIVKTNASSQIRYRMSFSNANVYFNLRVNGWYDRRGQDA